MIRLAVPAVDESDVEAVRDVLLSGHLVQGPRVAEFERVVGTWAQTSAGVAVSNCTAALHLALLAIGVGHGDRVAVTAFSWPATANVIVLCGAEPVFVDVDPLTFNMDPVALRLALQRGRVKAVLPVHVFGCMADMPKINAIADEFGVPVIEDAACALGAELGGKRAGSWGIAGCFSFHPRKAVTTGEGGMVATSDAAIARTCRALRNHGMDPDANVPDFIMPGFNLRLTEFQAALGLVQMGKLSTLIASRRCQASLYNELLSDSELQLPVVADAAAHVYQSYVVLLPRSLAAHRGEIIARLKVAGVETTIGTYHMPMTTFFRRHSESRPGMFPVVDDVSARALALPVFASLTDDQQRQVAATLLNAL